MDQHTHTDIEQVERVIRELRDSADTLIARSRELAEESERLKQRADDLTELIKRHLTGGPQPDLGVRSATGGNRIR